MYQILHCEYYEDFLHSPAYIKLLGDLGLLNSKEDGDNLSVEEGMNCQTYFWCNLLCVFLHVLLCFVYLLILLPGTSIKNKFKKNYETLLFSWIYEKCNTICQSLQYYSSFYIITYKGGFFNLLIICSYYTKLTKA